MAETVTERLLALARAGDSAAFRALTAPHRDELRVHCYRILGSLQDAEDVLQETLLAAWRGLGRFEARSSLRAWLYRIATNQCLNSLRAGSRRPRTAYRPEVVMPPPSRVVGDALWLQPYPDALLDEVPDGAAGPDARYELKESVSLAFVAAVQTLVPRQRAVLLLRDVLGYRAAEVAEMLETTEQAVNSALKRARAAMAQLRERDRDSAALPASAQERERAARFAEAFERGDVPAVIALLTDDAWLTMPPIPLQYQGRAEIAHFLNTVVYRDGRRYRLIPTRANGQPAFGCYVLDRRAAVAHAHGILVLTVGGDGITVVTRFVDNSVMPAFGFPRSLPC